MFDFKRIFKSEYFYSTAKMHQSLIGYESEARIMVAGRTGTTRLGGRNGDFYITMYKTLHAQSASFRKVTVASNDA